METKAWMAGLGLAAFATVAAASNALAVQARSPVDSGSGYGGGGSQYVSCTDTKVHNSYRLTVCDNGRYTVRGAGLTCSGTFSWYSTYGGVRINLRRAPCGSGTDWSEDSIRCGGFAWNRDALIDTISANDCTYFPTREAIGEGYRAERVYFQ